MLMFPVIVTKLFVLLRVDIILLSLEWFDCSQYWAIVSVLSACTVTDSAVRCLTVMMAAMCSACLYIRCWWKRHTQTDRRTERHLKLPHG
jgi:hypothetical protein